MRSKTNFSFFVYKLSKVHQTRGRIVAGNLLITYITNFLVFGLPAIFTHPPDTHPMIYGQPIEI